MVDDAGGAPQAEADRASRIAARCKRIQEKLAAARQGDASGTQEVTAQQEMTRTQQQLLDSARRLLQLKHDTQDAVTAARIRSDEHECQRRQRDDHTRQELRGKLLAEAEGAAAANAAISSRWAGVLSLNVPQDMFLAIEQQRLACEAVMASKDQLIADIRNALKAKDEDYVKLLKRQAADVDAMLAAMAQQLEQLPAAYREELEGVERVLLQERAELMAGSRKEVGALLEARATAEATFTDKYLAAVSSYAANLEHLRHADAEEYQVLKIKLESDIAMLEQHLEMMRATYQLNAEKLEYNYRVLLERDAENKATINQQKRKMSRQHDVLLGLRGKYGASDARFCDENGKLTEEYKRITEHFKDMQAKFSHFGRVDATKYSQLWRLQQREAGDMVRQLLAADRVLHEQQLGWQWQPPDASLFVSPHDAPAVQQQQQLEPAAAAGSTPSSSCSSAAAAPGGAGTRGSWSGFGVADADAASACRQSQGGAAAGAAARGSYRSCQGGAVVLPASPGRSEVAQRLRAPHYYGALCLLVDEAGFLVEAKTAALLQELPANEARAVAAEAIVRALGVTDGPGFDALIDALSADGGGSSSSSGGGSRSTSGAGGPPVLVHPSDALLRLKQFVEAEAGVVSSPGSMLAGGTAARGLSAAASGSTPGPGSSRGEGGPASPASASSTQQHASGPGPVSPPGAAVVSRRAAEREREYWQRLTQAVSGRVMRVWGKLEQQLGAYHRLLVARGEGLAAIAKLQRENNDLRAALNGHLGSKVAAELHVPPLAVL